MKIAITDKQILLLKEEYQLDELRRGYFNYIIEKVEKILGQKWPDYVLLDWLYKNTKNFDPKEQTPESYQRSVLHYIRWFIKEYGEGHWEFKKVKLNFNSFTDWTQRRFTFRKFGDEVIDFIPNDEERTKKQQELIHKHNISPEPIILIQQPTGYELFEGWHRTMVALKEYGEYEQNAYIYIPNKPGKMPY